MIDKLIIAEGVKMIIAGLGVDPQDGNFVRTPERVAKVYEELFSPKTLGEVATFDEDHTNMVIMRGHSFHTLCPHHLLPVNLHASVAYIPNGKVVGASKLMRMMHEVNTYPKTQERLTDDILTRLNEMTEGTSRGAAVLLEGQHGCFSVRGVKSPTASMITSKFSGEFLAPEMQWRFLSLVWVNHR